MRNTSTTNSTILGLMFIVFCAGTMLAQTTAFTYQGKLTDAAVSQPTSGSYDIQFRLFDSAAAGQGNQLGSTLSNLGIAVSGGIFTANLDFGAAPFDSGTAVYLELSIRPSGSPGGYTSLAPRQQITSAPFAVKSLNAVNAINAANATNATNAATAANATNAINATNAVNAQNASNATNATNAGNAGQLGGVAASQYVQTNDSRLADNRNPLAGSSSYIQNGTGTQSSSNFHITGNGVADGVISANSVDTMTSYKIGSVAVLRAPAGANTFAGLEAGAISSGTANSFFGFQAGVVTTNGANNTFLGSQAGLSNTSGGTNVFVGSQAGGLNKVGSRNTFVGSGAGIGSNTDNNTFVGYATGNTTTGSGNSFFGAAAGISNQTGTANAFFGFSAGLNNTTGGFNAFYGSNSGAANTTSINNAFFGQASGFRNTVGHDNTFLGNNSGANNIDASNNTFVGSLSGDGNTSGINNAFFGYNSGGANVGGGANTFIGVNSGLANVGSSNNTFIGANAGNSNLTGSGNTLVGANSDTATLATNAVAIGQKAFAGQSNSVILGSINGVNGSTADADVGIGTSTPAARLHVVGNSFFTANVGLGTSTPSSRLHVLNNTDNSVLIESNAAKGAGIELKSNRSSLHNWSIYTGDAVNNQYDLIFYDKVTNSTPLLVEGGSTGNAAIKVDGLVARSVFLTATTGNGDAPLCLNSSINRIAFCSSSLRYKSNIQSFEGGLTLLNKLKPITFDWKSTGKADLGFGAEQVAAVEPLLVTHNEQGEIEGVKYDRISAVLVNAVKEQQAQIVLLQKQIVDLQKRMVRTQKHKTGRRVR